MRECIADAYRIMNMKERVIHFDLVIKLANAMFALRCKHAHYYEEDVKKSFQDTKGMTTDELTVSHQCDCGDYECTEDQP